MLACVALVGHGRRLQSTHEQVPSTPSAERSKPAHADDVNSRSLDNLVRLLLLPKSEAAFMTSSPGLHDGTLHAGLRPARVLSAAAREGRRSSAPRLEFDIITDSEEIEALGVDTWELVETFNKSTGFGQQVNVTEELLVYVESGDAIVADDVKTKTVAGGNLVVLKPDKSDDGLKEGYLRWRVKSEPFVIRSLYVEAGEEEEVQLEERPAWVEDVKAISAGLTMGVPFWIAYNAFGEWLDNRVELKQAQKAAEAAAAAAAAAAQAAEAVAGGATPS